MKRRDNPRRRRVARGKGADDSSHKTGVPDNPEVWADPERHSAFVTCAKFIGIENYMNLREGICTVGMFGLTCGRSDNLQG